MAKHTPGPWIAWDDGRTVGILADERPGDPDDTDYNIAILEIVDHGGMADEDQMRADQELAPAAPEMLAALKKIADALEACLRPGDALVGALFEARTAISKAEGQ